MQQSLSINLQACDHHRMDTKAPSMRPHILPDITESDQQGSTDLADFAQS